MRQRFETTLVVDRHGSAHIEGPLAVAPGRHRAVIVVEDAAGSQEETWDAFIERTYGSLATSDLARPPQGEYEQREQLA